MSLTRIGSIGINTGIAFAGVTTIVTLNTANDALSIGATVNVGSGITLGASGDVFFTGIATGNGSGLTALNATQLTSGTVPTARLGSGTASSSTFLRGDSTFQTVNTDLVSDTSPQLGGDLDLNGNNITGGANLDLTDTGRVKLGTGDDLQIYHNGSGNFIDVYTNHLQIRNEASEVMSVFKQNGSVELYYDGTKNFETKAAGANFYGDASAHTDVTIYGSEGRDANLELFADDGDDNADKWRILSSTDGSFYVQNYTSGSWEFNLKATGNGAVELYHDNTKVFETDANGIHVTTNVHLPDNGVLEIGTGSDLQLYHDGSHSYIKDAGTGNLRVLTNTFTVNNAANSANMINATEGGSIELFHNGTKQCETSANGLAFPSGKGIDFSATGDGSGTSSSELFDDYEEGTWTPALPYGNSGSNYDLQYAYYTKIGRQVTILVYISNISIPNDGAEFRITGLPYGVSSGHGFGNFGYVHTGNYTDPLFPVFSQGASRIYFHRSDGNTNTWKNSDAVSTGFFNTYLLMGGTYFAAT